MGTFRGGQDRGDRGTLQSLLRKFPSTILDWVPAQHLRAEIQVQKSSGCWWRLLRYGASEGQAGLVWERGNMHRL